MAKIKAIDVIKGISGKYGSKADDYFATNTSSNQIHLAKYANPYTGDPTEKQQEVRTKFAARQAATTAWLNANKPSEANGTKGTAAYQYVEKLKKSYGLSNINQILNKYMDSDYKINLPASAGDTTDSTDSGTTKSEGSETDSGSSTTQGSETTEKVTLTLTASPEEGGTISGAEAGSFDKGTEITLTASSSSTYAFTKWENDSTDATRTLTLDADTDVIAYFTKTSSGFVG